MKLLSSLYTHPYIMHTTVGGGGFKVPVQHVRMRRNEERRRVVRNAGFVLKCHVEEEEDQSLVFPTITFGDCSLHLTPRNYQ